jgi:hypothetical protein
MSALTDLIEATTWIIFSIVVLSFLAPSLSKRFRQKLSGTIDEEKFDLDELIRKKHQKLSIMPQEGSVNGLYRQAQLHQEIDVLALIKEFYWGAGERFESFYKELNQSEGVEDSLRETLKALLEIQEWNHPVELEAFRRRVVVVTLQRLNRLQYSGPTKNLNQEKIDELYQNEVNKGQNLHSCPLLMDKLGKDSDREN